jgi:hypothetical protein
MQSFFTRIGGVAITIAPTALCVHMRADLLSPSTNNLQTRAFPVIILSGAVWIWWGCHVYSRAQQLAQPSVCWICALTVRIRALARCSRVVTLWTASQPENNGYPRKLKLNLFDSIRGKSKSRRKKNLGSSKWVDPVNRVVENDDGLRGGALCGICNPSVDLHAPVRLLHGTRSVQNTS